MYDVPDSNFQVNNDLPSSNNQEKNNISSINQDVYNVPFIFYQETNEQQPMMNQKEMYEQPFIDENIYINKEIRPSDEDSVNYSFNSLFDFNFDYPLLHQSEDTGFVYNNNNLIFQEDNSPWNEPSYISDCLSDPFI